MQRIWVGIGPAQVEDDSFTLATMSSRTRCGPSNVQLEDATHCAGSQLVGGWGWIRSGAESPTGNPSPAPSASAAHASHARHDRSMARWISEVRAKVGGFGSSPTIAKNYAPSSGCPFVHFEQGHITFFVDMFERHSKNTVFVNCRSFEQGITMVFFTTRCRMLESRCKNRGLVNYG